MSWALFTGHILIAALATVCAIRKPAEALFSRLRLVTLLSIRAFFGLLAVQQLFEALQSREWIIAVVTVLLFFAFALMLVGLMLDTRRAIVRFSNALAYIIEEYDGLSVVKGEAGREMVKRGEAEQIHVGTLVVGTISHALYGDPAEDEQ